jgi:hypothetical protein
MSQSEINLKDGDLQQKIKEYMLKFHIDIINGYNIINNNKSINRDELYKHLLKYTYAATEMEVQNHNEVTKILKEIRNTLLKHVNPTATAPITPPTGSG